MMWILILIILQEDVDGQKQMGSCGACIDATFTDSKGVVDKVTLLLCHPLRKYNGKKYKLIEIEDVRTGGIFIEIEETMK